MLRADIGIFISTLLLMGFGVVLVYSSSFPLAQHRFGIADFFLSRQVVRALLGVACLIVFINIDYHLLAKASHVLYITALVLLGAVLLLPESMAINGARRWLQIGSMRVQVSDFARMAMIITLSSRLDYAGERVREGRVILQQVCRISLICGLVLMEPDFSTACILAAVGSILLFAAGMPLRWMAGAALAAVPAMLYAVVSAPYRRERIMGYLHLSSHRQNLGYQAYQALLGLGNGGLFGVGLGGAERKLLFLPEPHTDFVFSILGEELGFAGLVIVLGLYAFMLYRGIRIAMRAPDRLGQLMAVGFTSAIGLYVIIHAGVNVGLLPTTGVPLPFLSYGGMSIIFTMSSMGILLNISSRIHTQASSLRPAERRRPVPLARRRAERRRLSA